MSETGIGLLGLGGLFVLIFLRVPIGIALATAGILGYVALNGIGPALAVLGTFPFSTAYSAELSVIPMFVLMGNFAMVSGMSRDLYALAQAVVGHWRGGLASAAVVACSGFAAVSGSSIASAVTMGRVSLPEMKRYRYHPGLATGCIAAGGTLGILIPPSTGFILYALITEESVGQLFLAGVIPGLLLTALFMVTIAVIVHVWPERGPAGARTTLRHKLGLCVSAVPLLAIVVIVLGGIYIGAFTPTEAAAVGAFGTFLLALLRGALTVANITTTVLDTIKTTAMVFLIVIGAFLFNPFLALTGIPLGLAEAVEAIDAPKEVILALVVLGYMILGTFLEGLAMMVLTVPIVLPLIVEMGYDPVWFGVMMVIVLEMSLISPPLGLNVFVVKGIAEDVPMRDIFIGIIPFWLAMIVCVILVVAFPALALYLPETMIR